MTRAQIKNLSVGVGAGLLLTFLFVQQKPVDSRQHDRFMNDLQRIKQLDAEINRDLLSSQYELLSSYDPFVHKLEELNRNEADLRLIPPFIAGRKREQIEQALKNQVEVFREKTHLLEMFKSQNAILKNSLRYFPVLIAEASRAAAGHADLQHRLANLLRDILLFDLTPHSDLAGSLSEDIGLLSEDAAHQPALAELLTSVSSHARVIASVKPQVEAITEELTLLPTARSVDAISGLYLRDYAQALKVSEVYRLFLYLCSVSLLAYAADRTLSLVKSRGVVEQANRQLHDANAQLWKAKIEADAANFAKSTFLSTMSHEIRTPMNAILGYAQLMLRDPAMSADARTNLKIIGRSGEHLLALINDVLDMSKIEAGRIDLNPATFNLPELLGDLASMFRAKAAAKALQFEVVNDCEAARYVVADQVKLRQVLINLLANAVKFTMSGQITLHVTLENRGAERLWLVACVKDTGCGISEGEQARLFEPFSQTRSGRQSLEGTGLGLAVSRGYVRLMGGDITLVSSPGSGSLFRFEIPVKQGDAAQAVKEDAILRITSIRAGDAAPKILVADDHPENRGWLKQLLTSLGFSVREAENGEHAIHIWRDWSPRLILMDLHMPVMDGAEATRRIKADPRGSETFVVALTASAMDEDRRTIARSGADDFLAKPCLEGELLEKLGTLLNLTYDREDSSKTEGHDSAGIQALAAERLGELPPELVEGLRTATLGGNKRVLDKLILKVRETAEDTAQALQDLADRYEYDTLTRLLEES